MSSTTATDNESYIGEIERYIDAMIDRVQARPTVPFFMWYEGEWYRCEPEVSNEIEESGR